MRQDGGLLQSGLTSVRNALSASAQFIPWMLKPSPPQQAQASEAATMQSEAQLVELGAPSPLAEATEGALALQEAVAANMKGDVQSDQRVLSTLTWHLGWRCVSDAK